MSLRKIGLPLIGGALVVAVVYGFLGQPILVDVAPVREGPMEVTIDEQGKTRVKDRYIIYCPVDGHDRRIEHEVGDLVEEGQVLVWVDPLPSTPLDPRSRAQAAERIDAAQAEVTAAREEASAAAADAEYAAAQYDRVHALFTSGVSTRDALDRCDSEKRRTAAGLRSAEFRTKVAEHSLELARAALEYTTARDQGRDPDAIAVNAPAAGRVLSIHHESAGVVHAGEALLEIGDPHALEVEVDVLSHLAVQIEPGMEVRFERWGGAEPLVGRVRVVEPTAFTKVSALGVEEQRVWVISDIESSPVEWRRLGDGYRVEARFVIWREPRVTLLPSGALFRVDGHWSVFTVEDGRARSRPVEIGRRGAREVQVLSGVASGDRVISHPDDRLSDGARVRLRDDR